jgi:hypothetical protein
MWFAALSRAEEEPWFQDFLFQLLQAKPEVLSLLAKAPFGSEAPRFIRASLYDYRFATRDERKSTGAFWVRQYVRPYTPELRLKTTETLGRRTDGD